MASRYCPVCGRVAGLKCSGCQSVFYCNPAHQKMHWETHEESCGGFLIKDDPEVGKHWVASRDLKAGTVLLTEDASIVTINVPANSGNRGKPEQKGENRDVCITCARGSPWNSCPKCQWPVCNSVCAKADIHASNECKFFKKYHIFNRLPASLQKFFGEFLFLIRAIGLKQKSPEKYMEVLQLFDDPGDRSAAVDMSRIQNVTQFLEKSVGLVVLNVTQEECEKLYRIMELNALDRKDPDWHPDVTVRPLYVKASRMNHSCVPNCVLHFPRQYPPRNFPVPIRVIKDVAKGEHLNVSYIGPLLGTRERQQLLQKNFGFTCKCERCVDPTELGAFISAVVCPPCRWGKPEVEENVGYFLPRDPLDLADSAEWECNNCHSTKPASEITGIHQDLHARNKEKIGQAVENGVSMDQLFFIHMTLVQTERHDVVHPNHFALAACSIEAIEGFLVSRDIRTNLHALVLLEAHLRRHLFILEKVWPGRSPTRATFLKALADVLQRQQILGKKDVYGRNIRSLQAEAGEFESEDDEGLLEPGEIRVPSELVFLQHLFNQRFF